MLLLDLIIGPEASSFLGIGLVALLGIIAWGFKIIHGQSTRNVERLEAKFDTMINNVGELKEAVGKLETRLDLSKARIEFFAKENRRLARMVNSLFKALHMWDVLMARKFPELLGLSVTMPELEPEPDDPQLD